MQIADGLQHAHSRGIIHRDLKPSNIIIQIDKHGKETPKIVDFGIARLTSESGKEIKQLTLDGTTCGSPPYMSPEQCMGEPVDERSDIYSLGCMMYELLSGQRPFRANSRIEMMEKHVEQIPRMFRSVCPELQVPESLEAIVRTCLAKKLEQRYQNMSELLNDLKEIGSESVAENNLKQELKEELKKELEAFKKFRLKILQAWLMPIAGIALLGCAGFAIYKQLVPETKIEKFNNEFKAIKADDTNSISKKVHLGLQIVELDAKTGNQTAALLMVKDLDKQVHQMAPSLARSQYLARIARSYLALGRNAESELLMNQVIAELEAHIERCNNLGDLAGLEPASMLVIKICRDIPDKRDHALGQYNRLISAYIHRGNNQKAERLCVDALAIIKATGRPPDIGEVTILQFLSVAQAKQGKMDLAEQSLLRAWKIVEKGWAEDSAVYQNCARKIFDLYASQGKSTEAEKFKSMLK
jgi:tetratricopeptide (TPR) repeat protein